MKNLSWLAVIAILATSFGVGYMSAQLYNNHRSLNIQQKPVLLQEPESVWTVGNSNEIVWEREYEKCGHVIISAFDNRQSLLGYTLNDLEIMFAYSPENKVTVQEDTVVIHQLVNDWCPQEKDRLRLKIYQGHIAVYQGPSKDNDQLLRVTNIQTKDLPAEIQDAINNNQYEFETQDELNDILENMDEYS